MLHLCSIHSIRCALGNDSLSAQRLVYRGISDRRDIRLARWPWIHLTGTDMSVAVHVGHQQGPCPAEAVSLDHRRGILSQSLATMSSLMNA